MRAIILGLIFGSIFPLSASAQSYFSRVVGGAIVIDTGNEKSMELTLSGTPNTITTVTIPSGSLGFKLYPRTNHVRFGVYLSDSPRSVVVVSTSALTVVPASQFSVGGIAKPDQWETRILPTERLGADRIIKLLSTTASVVVDLEFF